MDHPAAEVRTGNRRIEDVLRAETPHVLGALVRRFGRFALAEDATQEALLAASRTWTAATVPEEPRSWLIRVGYRKMIDLIRSEQASRRREEEFAYSAAVHVDADQTGPVLDECDDSLHLLFLCCHPALGETSQVALTLRAVGGLTTAEIAHAYGTTEATMGTRISRAKQTLKRARARFEIRADEDLAARTATVMRVLYLVFNEGYTASAGDELSRADLTAEAIRLTRMLCTQVPDDPEAIGLLSLMLSTEARRTARTDTDDELVPLAEQDRFRWDTRLTVEGTRLIEQAWAHNHVGPYQLQAAIASTHTQAKTAAETDWPQIAALYLWLERLQPTAPVRLGRVVAVAHAFGPRRGIALLDEIDRTHHITDDPLVAQRARAVRAHLLDQLGDGAGARKQFRAAAELTANDRERRYLLRRAGDR
ncbi:RNA polymerase ECF-subfamily sigma factor [Rhodococcus sp. RD6.2]|uniref:RNA polymerase sigma factor n=1 Tax=Rhodococcus sp. RD6.2 TaxID=260936 RepID=UPI00063B2B37|nr:sigma-70 family RNA polymerase sigma factor [Rhodococcus sp. RD6.2]CRK50813.1 RNA polymerase ECF-subfamily sigma factor [Rhodococcus sp. RD6.2]